MKHILTFIFSLLAVCGWAANPAFTAFIGTNQVVISSNVTTGKIIIGPATPISTIASNAAISLNLWTNNNGQVLQITNAPVVFYQQQWIGTNASNVVAGYGFEGQGLQIGFDTTLGDPVSILRESIVSGPGNYTKAVELCEVKTNRVLASWEIENDDLGYGFNATIRIDETNSTFRLGNILGTPIDLVRMIPAAADTYLFRSLALGAGRLFIVANHNTNALEVSYDGHGTNNGRWSAASGLASYSTIATNQIPTTGWTNNAAINVTVYTTATAVSFTINNRAGTVLYTSPTLTATIPVNLQPGWSVRAASGLQGTVVPF